MTFVRVSKDNTYFKRFQVKPRRRREGKTDFKARRRLTQQAKNKYNTPKYRFVVRITNSDVVCQVMYSKTVGDICICAAYAHELKQKYGIKAGLTNYAAAYATGLLCARRLLTKIGAADKYQGVKEADGKFAVIAPDQRPFIAVLDIGLAHTTTGARIFGALKGASDGGLYIPHSPKRFPGSSGDSVDADAHRARILGEHVAEYMEEMKSDDADKAKKHFSQYLKGGVDHDGVANMWKACHAAIRKDPSRAPAKKFTGKPKNYAHHKYGTKERLHIRSQRREKYSKEAAVRKRLYDQIAGGAADSDEDEE